MLDVVALITRLEKRIQHLEELLGDDPLVGEKPPVLHRIEAIEQQLMDLP